MYLHDMKVEAKQSRGTKGTNGEMRKGKVWGGE